MDVQFHNHGSLWLAQPLTDAAQDWIDEHVSDDTQWFGQALIVEPRYVAALAKGMADDGLTVGGPQ